MELVELLVWGVAVVAAALFQWLSKRRQNQEPARQAPASRLPEGLFQPPPAPAPEPAAAATPAIAADASAGPSALEDIHWGRGLPVPEVPVPMATLPPPGQHLPVPLSALHGTVPASRVAAQPPREWHPARRTRKGYFRTRADVRQAVIGMTILGPCRALSPYGQESDAGSRPANLSAGARTPPAP